MTAHSSNDGGFGPLTVKVAREIIKNVEKRLKDDGYFEHYIATSKERMAWALVFRDDLWERYDKYGDGFLLNYLYNMVR